MTGSPGTVMSPGLIDGERHPAGRGGSADTAVAVGHRSSWLLALLVIIALIGAAGFTALGIWQIERRAWKRDLIARVEGRIHAPAVTAPGPAAWPQISIANDEYRRVTAKGEFLNDRETLVQAVTALGGGYWVLTPFRTADGFTVLVNRGFVPPELRDPATRPTGQVGGETTVTGVLRLTEPKGALLRENDPAGDRWYSRDVAAIAKARHLPDAAPYFIDADRIVPPNPGPVGGLTVTAFSNNHLVYALTWFSLALMVLWAAAFVLHRDYRLRHQPAGTIN
ncbi:SURF1 family protein [Chelatococcus asaccharovorans]|uniref:SURF1-like protein n=1 Tax=Chelatococcus asaccharovorans TaxID=28210 RepID=A0A2V3TZ09_9HYPH|nr:SURF1 family protein [Chelatococcus asaccharovorans]PXW54089.1 surfeit locus 1 family protein [Chelatococcus asaccharovorans]